MDATLELKRRRELRTDNLTKPGEHVPEGILAACIFKVFKDILCTTSFDTGTALFQMIFRSF